MIYSRFFRRFIGCEIDGAKLFERAQSIVRAHVQFGTGSGMFH